MQQTDSHRFLHPPAKAHHSLIKQQVIQIVPARRDGGATDRDNTNIEQRQAQGPSTGWGNDEQGNDFKANRVANTVFDCAHD
jgi:hypothetical protein